MTSLTKCSDDKHLYQVRFICQHEDCENSFLCLACFQTHHQDKNCRGVYGVDIKDIEGVFEDAYEIITETTPVIKKESLIKEHTLKKMRLLERIQRVFDQENDIYRQNEEALDEFEGSVVKYLKTRTMKWKQDQVNDFRGESAEVFFRLESIQEALENMEFETINFSNNSQTFKKLNNEIAGEVEELSNLAEQKIGSWKLSKERLDDYLRIIYKAIEGVGFSSLFDNEKLEYDISSLIEFSEDYKLLKKEIEVLKPRVNELMAENKNLRELSSENGDLRKQVEILIRSLELRTTKRNELGAKVLQLEELVQNLRDENQRVTRDRDELAKDNRSLSQTNSVLIDERNNLRRDIQALIPQRNDVGTGGDWLGDDEDW